MVYKVMMESPEEQVGNRKLRKKIDISEVYLGPWDKVIRNINYLNRFTQGKVET